MYPLLANPIPRPVIFSVIPPRHVIPATRTIGDTRVLLSRAGPAGVNLEALAAWQRAHGGTILLVNRSGEAQAAALPHGAEIPHSLPDDWTPTHLHALGPVRSVTRSGHPAIGTALLDRDGTIMIDRDYLAEPDGVALLPGAAEGLGALQAAGIRRVVVSNQSGVGSGRIPAAALAAVNARLGELLAHRGVRLDGIYCCPHRPEAGCDCRKPATGLAHQAAADLGLDLTRAVVAGDKASDLGLARALGIPAVLVTTGYGMATLNDLAGSADYVVDGLDQLARLCTHPAGLLEAADSPLP